MARGGEDRGISRRTLLVGGGVGLGLAVAWSLWPRSYRPNLRTADGETAFNAFLKVGRDGRVIVAVPQAELGQGSWTALPQILADELGADWRTVSVEPAPIGPLYANLLLAEAATGDSVLPATFGIDRWTAREYAVRNAVMVTGGSTSVRAFEAPLREAGAGARALLSMAAAARWGANWEELDTHDGFVWRGDQRLSFAELADAAATRELPENLPVRGGIDNRLTGRALPRIDVPSKIDGTAMFAADIRLRDMVYAAVRSAPPGSRRVAVDWDAADGIPGALRVIENPEWTAVVATNGWAAGKALDGLKPRYDRPAGPSDRGIADALGHALDAGDARRVHEIGEPDRQVPGTSRIDALYAVGPAPGAPIEPLVATARLEGDRLEIWAPTQAPGLARAAAARAAGMSEGRVTLYPTLAGGGYGRKLEVEAIAQAAVIAVKIERPVQVTWPRIQEIQRDAFRPPAAARLSAWVADGRIRAWQARVAAPETSAEVAARLGVAARFFRPDGGPVAGAVPPYGIDHVAIDHVGAETGLATGIWRGGARSYTAFFTECFIDELARAVGAEPFSFRMGMLGGNPRLARCLATATAIGGWDGGPPGSGMGIAAASAFGSHIAALVEVEMSRAQRLRVLRAVCAVDCGRVINPELVKQQIEGGLIHGISAAVGRPIRFAGGLPTIRTIADYGLPVLRDAPDVTVELLESEEEPGGVTELAVPVAAPAVANGWFSLSGRRARSLPIAAGQR
ncbi:molybdopterin-dependent oxidoreductase [Sphingosinicella sp. LHD-64]|uniref:molybdopterin cofactor-binding domain-containing protein n=1 Tax=Sphingosinicella sp. LHD-64 TaxID=3072139 RepID=UPI00280F9519|nr:molybdopterin cofactor-binding domain-containing protein [Sphingosinicella sp. LHD-64]MDQ8758285.1 molybdopterin-dependent oxidoreductase [Sphingosinicella sp. LHD-64]